MRFTTPLVLALALCLSIAAPSAARAAGGGGGGGGGGLAGGAGEPTGSRAYEKIAAKRHERGIRYVKQAQKIEARIVNEADPARRTKLESEAEALYRRALKQFQSALSRQPDYHKAHSDKGYVMRKLGLFEPALAAYNRALAIEPDYAPAIEYRGEAYLELGRLDDAKKAYLSLFASDGDLADMLLEKMQTWVTRRRTEPADLEEAALEDFARWVESRREIAQQAARTGVGATRTW